MSTLGILALTGLAVGPLLAVLVWDWWRVRQAARRREVEAHRRRLDRLDR